MQGASQMNFLSRRERERQMAELVIEACSLVASGTSARSVRILVNNRPTVTDLRRYRELARAQHVCLWVDDEGVIAVRPEVDGEGDR